MKNTSTMFVVIIVMSMFFTGCSLSRSASTGINDNQDSDLIGGWVYSDQNYTPILSEDYSDYKMIEIKDDTYYEGYLDSLSNGSFYWNFGLYYSSNGEYTSELKKFYTYSLTDDMLLLTGQSSGSTYTSGYRFNFNNDKTTALVEHIYSSSGEYYTYTSGAFFLSKITDYTNRGYKRISYPSADQYESNDSRDEATAVAVDATYEVNFHSDADIDLFSFTADTDTTYVIETMASDINDRYILECEDTIIGLYDGTGGLITTDDDSGLYGFSKIEWTCTTAGTYYIEVTPYKWDYAGTYGISITTKE